MLRRIKQEAATTRPRARSKSRFGALFILRYFGLQDVRRLPGVTAYHVIRYLPFIEGWLRSRSEEPCTSSAPTKLLQKKLVVRAFSVGLRYWLLSFSQTLETVR